jgi:hypothetical protein
MDRHAQRADQPGGGALASSSPKLASMPLSGALRRRYLTTRRPANVTLAQEGSRQRYRRTDSITKHRPASDRVIGHHPRITAGHRRGHRPARRAPRLRRLAARLDPTASPVYSPRREWSGHELALLLDVKPRNMLTQLGE